MFVKKERDSHFKKHDLELRASSCPVSIHQTILFITKLIHIIPICQVLFKERDSSFLDVECPTSFIFIC